MCGRIYKWKDNDYTYLDDTAVIYDISFKVRDFSKEYINIEKDSAIDFEDLLPQKSYEGIIYQDPVEPLQMTVNELRNDHKCDLVIVLSHLGFQYDSDKIDDLKLAQKTEGIDAILGGHTHTFLDKPILVKNKMGKNTVVNQAGWAGLRLGKLHFHI
jgi:5'-nucleotidase